MIDLLTHGRDAYIRQAWSDAFTELSAADRAEALDPEDLDCLATAAYLVGDDAASADARTRAYQAFLQRGAPVRAAGSAIWLAFVLVEKRNREAEIAGWLARARRLLDEHAEDCVELGFLMCLGAWQQVGKGDLQGAHVAFAKAASMGERFGNADLTSLARHGAGRALLRLDHTAEGLACLDEAMVAVTAGEVGPIVAGVIYCSVISACHDIFDLGRAQEWTTALEGWCGAHPDIVPFRGPCLIRRSELLQLHGAWEQAGDEARRACERLAAPQDGPDAGSAFYQQAELFRLRGEFEQADEAYTKASRAGRRPQPGLALLRLAQGDTASADAAIRSALLEVRPGRLRASLLSAAVEIMLAGNDLPAARLAAEEIAQLAHSVGASLLRAVAAHAGGAVALASGDAEAAAGLLREAWREWRELNAPYEVARVRALIGVAYAALGDAEGARMEFDAALEVFEHLGAAPDAARVAAPLTPETPQPSGGLTGREVEVLRHIATGKTNRVIAGALAISEKTVARHVSNIFTKLDLPSRAAATAYAYEHKLL